MVTDAYKHPLGAPIVSVLYVLHQLQTASIPSSAIPVRAAGVSSSSVSSPRVVTVTTVDHAEPVPPLQEVSAEAENSNTTNGPVNETNQPVDDGKTSIMRPPAMSIMARMKKKRNFDNANTTTTVAAASAGTATAQDNNYQDDNNEPTVCPDLTDQQSMNPPNSNNNKARFNQDGQRRVTGLGGGMARSNNVFENDGYQHRHAQHSSAEESQVVIFE
jgi:hypothetical protein